MKKFEILFLLLCLFLFNAACSNDDNGPTPPEPREQVGRTVLVYIVGDAGDKYNDISSLFKNNFEDMKKGMKEVDYSKCNLVVYSQMINDAPHLISIKNKNGVVVADTLFTFEAQNPLDKTVMKKVISQTLDYFPADSYGFVFISHSSSWAPADNDANSRAIGIYHNTQMNIPDFHEALLSFPKPLEFILFDCCNMQAIEVAYELRDCANYFIGSPAEIPGPGASYKTVVPELFTDTNVATNIANAYFNYYNALYTGQIPLSNDNWTGGVATSVIKSNALNALAAATHNIIPNYISINGTAVDVSDIQLYDFGGSYANYDLDGLICQIAGGTTSTEYQAWRTLFDEAVIMFETTDKNYSGVIKRMFSMSKSAGVSSYIPSGNVSSKMNAFYHTLQWYSAAGWDQTGW